MNGLVKRCSLTVHRYWLVLLAGLVWLSVGIVLVEVACYWFSLSNRPFDLLLAALGLVLGMVIYVYGFSRLATKNINRICGKPEQVCLFAFQSWRSYFLIFLMMIMGYTIRHLPIPKYIDAVIYLTMGSALAFSSSLYFSEFSSDCRRK